MIPRLFDFVLLEVQRGTGLWFEMLDGDLILYSKDELAQGIVTDGQNTLIVTLSGGAPEAANQAFSFTYADDVFTLFGRFREDSRRPLPAETLVDLFRVAVGKFYLRKEASPSVQTVAAEIRGRIDDIHEWLTLAASNLCASVDTCPEYDGALRDTPGFFEDIANDAVWAQFALPPANAEQGFSNEGELIKVLGLKPSPSRPPHIFHGYKLDPETTKQFVVDQMFLKPRIY